MNFFENHNTCIGKYGELTIKMEENGISPKYLLSACRFHTENNIPIKTLSLLFKQWNYYVMRNNPTDVNKLTFTEFRNILDNCKREYGIPNKVFDDGKVSVGRITSSKDLSKLPIKNDWCINKPNQYQKYMNDGWRFYLIDNGDTSDYIRYVLLMVGDNGKRYYYDLDNNVMNERDIAEFETHLTPEAKFFVEKLQEQTIYKRNKQLKTENRMKKTIQLTESDIRKMVMEAMNELDWKTYANAAEKQHVTGDNPNREDRFKKTAADAFNRDYGVNGEYTDFLKPNQNSYKMLDKGWNRFNHYPVSTFTTRTVGGVNDNGKYDDEFNTYRKEKQIVGGSGVTHDVDSGHGGIGYHTHGYNPEFTDSIDTDLRTAHERGNKEIDDYVNGKYNYQKGKGWTKDELEEAVARAIRKYLC